MRRRDLFARIGALGLAFALVPKAKPYTQYRITGAFGTDPLNVAYWVRHSATAEWREVTRPEFVALGAYDATVRPLPIRNTAIESERV